MQPAYLPWLGYYALIDQVDTFVLLDDVEYSHGAWHNRNRIKKPDGIMWLTVPVLKSGRSGQAINETEINTEERWRDKHRKSLKHLYASAPHASLLESWLEDTYGRSWQKLCPLSVHTTKSLGEHMGLGEATDFVLASSLEAEGRKAHRLVDLCQSVGATEYLSPIGSLDYIESDNPFPKAGIELRYLHFEHPTYDQLHGDFVSHLSTVDLLMNEGPRSLEIIRSGECTPYTSEEAREIKADTGASG